MTHKPLMFACLFGMLGIRLASLSGQQADTAVTAPPPPAPETQPAPAIRAGEVNVLPDGVYGQIRLNASHSGSPERPTVIRAANRWKAAIRPGIHNGIHALEDQKVSHVVLDGLEIAGSEWDGVRFYRSESLVIRNCWVHHCGNQGILLVNDQGSRVEDCLIEDNGFREGPNTSRHGAYIRSVDAVIARNIFRNNAGSGLQLFPAATRCLVADNIAYGHPIGVGISVTRDSSPAVTLKLTNANTVRRNLVRGCKTGVQVSGGFMDLLEHNLLRGNEFAWSLYYAPKGPVRIRENLVDGKTNDPTKMAWSE